MSVTEHVPELGAGLYSANELSRYLSSRELPASPPTVSRWIRRGLTPSQHRGRLPTYTFHDLISLLVVGWLREKGVTFAAVRRAESYLREQLRIERPFAREEIYTDGINVLYEANPLIADQLTAANLQGQEVMRKALEATLSGVRYDNSLAIWWDIRPFVRINPAIQFGEPCVAGTRIPTAQLAEFVAAGESIERLANLYELPPAWVDEAVNFERELTKAA
jgi:uncharacterized protein (DUF433 family)